MQNIEKFGVE